MILEGWNFIDLFYYVFILISMIGFGDIVFGQLEYFLVFLIYLFLGLVLVFMCINVGVDYFNVIIDKVKIQMDKVRDRMIVVGKKYMKIVGEYWGKVKVRVKMKVFEVKFRV